MKKIVILFLLFNLTTKAQTKVDTLNTNYIEDQLYVGITYNLLTNKPNGIDLRGFSSTKFIGYLRDFPINTKRNIGFGLGLGYSRSTYLHNMKIHVKDNQTIFDYFKDVDNFSANKLIYHSIDIPFEFRIRNSTIDKTKFFRFYTGIKVSYIFYHKSEYNLEGIQRYKRFEGMNKIQYGVTASIGHGTWNGYFYYGLTNLFDNPLFNKNKVLHMKSVRFGLIIYVL